MYYYVDNGKSGKNIKVHLSDSEEYINSNTPLWSKSVVAFRIGTIHDTVDINHNDMYFVVVEKYRYNEFDVIKIFSNWSEAKNWVYRKKRAIYPREYSYNVVLATKNYFSTNNNKTQEVKKSVVKEKDSLENHKFAYKYAGDGTYLITDNDIIVARVDSSTEAKEWIEETKEEILKGAE